MIRKERKGKGRRKELNPTLSGGDVVVRPWMRPCSVSVFREPPLLTSSRPVHG